MVCEEGNPYSCSVETGALSIMEGKLRDSLNTNQADPVSVASCEESGKIWTDKESMTKQILFGLPTLMYPSVWDVHDF